MRASNTALTAVPPPKRGFGVLIMLITVPVVWTALLAPMMDQFAEAVVATIAFAGLAGLFVGLGPQSLV